MRFVNVNVASMDAVKHSGVGVQADARETLTALTDALAGWSVDDAHRTRTAELAAAWEATVEAAYHPEVPSAGEGGRLTQNEEAIRLHVHQAAQSAGRVPSVDEVHEGAPAIAYAGRNPAAQRVGIISCEKRPDLGARGGPGKA